jgi:uncharacterized protein (TIGR02145 family)
MKSKSKFSYKALFSFVVMFSILSMFILSCSDDNGNNQPTSLTDADGNVYHSVTIGSQVWMLENLKTTKFRNGVPIPLVTDNTTWSNLGYGAYCNYNNDTALVKTYGRLYNWYAANDSRNIAPAGWHVATDDDWTKLTEFLGGLATAGGKLKDSGYVYWSVPNAGATNEYGFKALPGGYRTTLGAYNYLGYEGHWWTSTTFSTLWGWPRSMVYNDSDVNRIYNNRTYGMAVRCVKD